MPYPYQTRSKDHPERREKMKHCSPKPERLYPDLEKLKDDSSPKHSPAAARRGNRGKKDKYRDRAGNDSSDTDSVRGSDSDDAQDEADFSPKRVNVSHELRGSSNVSFNHAGEDQSFHHDIGSEAEENLSDSKFSLPRTPQHSNVSYNMSSDVNISSLEVRKRHTPDQRRKKSPLRPHIETVSEYSDGGNRIWIIPDYCIYCILALFALALLYGMYLKVNDESTPVVQTEHMEKSDLDQLDKKLDEMRQKFPNQTERHWKIIRAQLKKLFRPGPQTQPAIILFAALPGAVEAMNCIAKEIGDIFAEITKSKSPVEVHGGELASEEDNKAKLELDEILSQRFQSGHRVVIMFELESFHGQPLLLLHSYCDHENAAFKDVVIMFTLRLDTNEADTNINDEFIEDYLATIWQNKVGIDEMGALRSRVANNKAIGQAELDTVLNRYCS
ncbi:torsin-1A-interacting protein 1-like [Lineus longissimus]|uniref:torsin-1A-interacting protein 1-like n=1 Tax=Lineus longissimus TaxID=88925 RepID=UPI002B4D5306